MSLAGSRHNYDRNATVIVSAYEQSVAAHAYTNRFSYTIPTNRNAQQTQYFCLVTPKIATAGKRCRIRLRISTDGGSTYAQYGFFIHDSTTQDYIYEVVVSTFYLMEGDIIVGQTRHDDTVNHTMSLNALCVEYDSV